MNTRFYSRKQTGGSPHTEYALLSDVFPSQAVVMKEVKTIMDSSLIGSQPMSQLEAVKTAEVVMDTVHDVVPGVSPGKIQDVVMNSISKNNVQMGGKALVMPKKKSTAKPKAKAATKPKAKKAVKPKAKATKPKAKATKPKSK